jgi:starch synthase
MTTPEHGMGLDGLLRARRASFVGIVNGIDTEVWDPAADRHIARGYSAADLSGKALCRSALLREVGLPERAGAPVFGVVSRLTAQKGFDLCFEVLPELLGRDGATLVALGTGERRYEDLFRALERRFPAQARFVNAYDDGVAHRIEAGADAFLMPSLYEPCGLNQMYSLRYGTLPVVRKTGGLADTVEPFDPSTGRGNGFVFDHYTTDGLRWALGQSLLAWRSPSVWRRLQHAAMSADWSWDRQILLYERLYQSVRR